MSIFQSLTSVVIFIFSSICFADVAGESKESSFDKNLKIEKNYLNRRYDGFYKHVKSYEDYQIIRKQKVKEHKVKRKEHIIKREKIRDLYKVKKAQIKKEEVDLDAIMLRIEKERNKVRKVKRKAFIRNREIMDNLKRTSRKIPVDIDVGLRRLGQKGPK